MFTVPPEVKGSVPLPRTLGEDAAAYLAAHGITAVTPCIRSSDLNLVLSDPFRYYLRRRLGLIEGLEYSEALNRGSWFHACLELVDLEEDHASRVIDELLHTRKEELKEICRHLGKSPEQEARILEREERDCRCTQAWFEVYRDARFPGSNLTLREFLTAPWLRCLGVEVRLVYRDPKLRGVTSLAQVDRLVYIEKQNKIYLIDGKTTKYPTSERAKLCPTDFQTRHYLRIAQGLIDNGALASFYDLPPDVTLGGMMHLMFLKPSIEFGQKDRDYEIIHHTLTRGPRKGQTIVKRVYGGEPQFSNYLQRCKEWLLGEGHYEHLHQQRMTDPVLNRSTTSPRAVMDPVSSERYHRAALLIRKYARCDPHPGLFPAASPGMKKGEVDRLIPLYALPPGKWPSIIKQLGLIRYNRDT